MASCHPPGTNCLLCSVRNRLSLLPANRQSRKPLESGGLCFFRCCFVVRSDVCLKQNSSSLLRISANVQETIDTGLKRKIPSLSVGLVSARNTPSSSHPVPTAGNRGNDESYCGGGAGCERTTFVFDISTPTSISSLSSSGV